MARTALDLGASLLLCLAAILGIWWLPDGSGSPGSKILTHTVEWLLGFFVFFLLMGLTDFPLWQRLGTAALIFGSAWHSQSGRNKDAASLRGSASRAPLSSKSSPAGSAGLRRKRSV
jgi:hypothetical protein